MLKIIGGYLAGRTILSVPGENTRPPLARVRESVGNILQTRVVGSKVLDLFAGTGSYSFELLSRGAERAILIDKNPRAVEIIKKNAAKLGLQSQTQVVHADALDMIKRFMQSRAVSYTHLASCRISHPGSSSTGRPCSRAVCSFMSA